MNKIVFRSYNVYQPPLDLTGWQIIRLGPALQVIRFHKPDVGTFDVDVYWDGYMADAEYYDKQILNHYRITGFFPTHW